METNEQIRIYKRMLENPVHTFKYATELKQGDIIKSNTELFIIHDVEYLPKMVKFYGYRFDGKKLEYGTMRKHKSTIVCCEYKRK